VLNSRAGIVVTAIIDMAGLRLSHSMHLDAVLPPDGGGCKIAIYIKFFEKNMFYMLIPYFSITIITFRIHIYRAHKFKLVSSQ